MNMICDAIVAIYPLNSAFMNERMMQMSSNMGIKQATVYFLVVIES